MVNRPNLFRTGLGTKLLRVIPTAGKFALLARSEISLVIFLASLYAMYPKEIEMYFESAEPLAQMVSEFSRFDVSAGELGATEAVAARFESSLTRVLTKTASRSGASPAELSDFMQTLLSDEEIVAELQKTRNLTPRPSAT